MVVYTANISVYILETTYFERAEREGRVGDDPGRTARRRRRKRHNALGRSDLEVEIGDRHWVFEFKYARPESDAEEFLDEAVRQIETRRYGNVQPGKDLIRVAVVFDGQRRCFCGWRRV